MGVSSSYDADEVVDAGDHAAYGLEGAMVTREVTLNVQGIRQGEVGTFFLRIEHIKLNKS